MCALPYQSYMICTNPRSGSTLLCELLKAVGCAGHPGSHFHQPSLARWLAAYGLASDQFGSRDAALRAVFTAAHARGRGDTPLFGVRMQRKSFPFFMDQVARLHPGQPSDVARIEAALGPTLFVQLHRPDKVAQAVSLVVAEQSGLWHRWADGSELERLAPPRAPEYDSAAIARHVDELTVKDKAWSAWFAREGVTPLRISYDELARAPQATLARVLDALGLDDGLADRVDAPTAKLADATNQAWVARFTEERAI